MTDLCNHDWVGDDECRYCICEALVERIAELEQDLREMDAENDRLSTKAAKWMQRELEAALTDAVSVARRLGVALREAKYQLNQGQSSSYVVAHIDKALSRAD